MTLLMGTVIQKILLRRWLKRQNGIKTLADLNERFIKIPPDLTNRKGISRTIDELKPRLVIITADLTMETEVEFPGIAPLYRPDYMQQNPSLFVRASMSIPCFFSPLKISNIPPEAEAKKNWEEIRKQIISLNNLMSF